MINPSFSPRYWYIYIYIYWWCIFSWQIPVSVSGSVRPKSSQVTTLTIALWIVPVAFLAAHFCLVSSLSSLQVANDWKIHGEFQWNSPGSVSNFQELLEIHPGKTTEWMFVPPDFWRGRNLPCRGVKVLVFSGNNNSIKLWKLWISNSMHLSTTNCTMGSLAQKCALHEFECSVEGTAC